MKARITNSKSYEIEVTEHLDKAGIRYEVKTTHKKETFGKKAFEFDETEYFVELNTLEDLVELSEKTCCNLVVGKIFAGGDYDLSVEIYDGYRE